MTVTQPAMAMSRRRTRWGPLAGWLGLVGGSVAAIIALHRLGGSPDFAVDWTDPAGWLERSSPEQVLLAGVRIAVLGAAYWVAATTLLATLARIARLPRLLRSVEWATLPAVRRLAQRVAAVSLPASTMATPAVVAGAPAAVAAQGTLGPIDPHPVSDGRYRPTPAGDLPVASTPTPALPLPLFLEGATGDGGTPGVEPHPAPPLARRPAEPVAAPVRAPARQASTHTVSPGDNLWSISADHLAAALNREPSPSEVAAYWSEVVAANRGSLRSGDPDLIFPGEEVDLPPIPEAER